MRSGNFRLTNRLSGSFGLCDENWDPPCGPHLVVRVRRIRRDGEIPEPCPLSLVLYFTNSHRLYHGVITDLDGRIDAEVVHPHRVCRRSSKRADEDVVGAILDAHQGGLANRAGLVACVGHDDHRQPGVAERGALCPATALVELDLVAHPLPGAWDVV